MPRPTGDEVATHYAAGHERLAALVSGLTDDELATPVPGTPPWTVHDVVAHLAALTTDVLTGRLTGMPTDAFTAGQVADRRDRPAAELLAEWHGNVGSMCDGARAGLVPANLAVDVLTHEQDVRAALGRPAALTPVELRFCTGQYAFGCGWALKGAGLPAIALKAADTDFATVAGAGEPAAAVTAPEFELFRGLSGRRSRRQVLAWAWEGDATTYVDRLNVFGPLPPDDLLDG